MSEERVTRTIMRWLTENGWTVLDYDFPGGGTGRKFHVWTNEAEKTRGIVTPDIIAAKNGRMVVFENKAEDTRSDYDKIRRLSASPDFANLVAAAYPEIAVSRISFAIGYAGNPKYADIAVESGVSVIVSVDEDEPHECRVVFGVLL